MVFSSIIFLFFFLPILLFSYLLAGKRGRNFVLLAASILFYLWGEQEFVLVMIASIIGNYFFGLLVEKTPSQDRKRKFYLAISILANIIFLAYFKYANFAADNLNTFFSYIGFNPVVFQKIHLPIGISFFTFQAISYLIDIYRMEHPAQKNILHFGLYISFFPQLVAGPIVRYIDVADKIKKRSLSVELFASGAERFIFGLGKKVLIANHVGQLADQIFSLTSDNLSFSTAWLGVVCYTLQIYFDFSGYSDMAVGLGRMFGFHFLENFNYPYISRSIREFWRRWHISLSTWFRDYLYIPLGGNRAGNFRTNLNLLIVFFLCGLWHGASWNFILWGLVYGFFLVIERCRFGKILSKQHVIIQHLYALAIISNAWVLFRLEKLSESGAYFAAMYGFAECDKMVPQISMKLDGQFFCVIVTGLLISLPIYPWIQAKYISMTKKYSFFSYFIKIIKLMFIALLFIYSVSFLAVGSYNPFIYFRF